MKRFGPGLLASFPHITAIDTPETVVTVGWTFWLPVFWMLWLSRAKKGGRGWITWLPLGTVLLLWLLYLQPNFGGAYADLLRRYVPFMEFFRVASRMGLFFPSLLGALVALGWPEISRWASDWRGTGTVKRWKQVALVSMAGIFLLELPFLAYPINVMPAMPTKLKEVLAEVQRACNMVLDFPFCGRRQWRLHVRTMPELPIFDGDRLPCLPFRCLACTGADVGKTLRPLQSCSLLVMV